MQSRKSTKVLDAIKKGDKLVRGSTLESNRKILLKAARYRDPTSTTTQGEGIDEEDIDEIQAMDINLGSDMRYSQNPLIAWCLFPENSMHLYGHAPAPSVTTCHKL